MGIEVQWDNPEHTLIRYLYSGQWSLDNFYEALHTSHEMLDTVDYSVGIIIDMTNSKLVPNGVLSHGKNITMRKHQNQGKSIIIGAGGLVRTLFDVYRKVYRAGFDDGAYGFASNLEEARETLLKDKQSVLRT